MAEHPVSFPVQHFPRVDQSRVPRKRASCTHYVSYLSKCGYIQVLSGVVTTGFSRQQPIRDEILLSFDFSLLVIMLRLQDPKYQIDPMFL